MFVLKGLFGGFLTITSEKQKKTEAKNSLKILIEPLGPYLRPQFEVEALWGSN